MTPAPSPALAPPMTDSEFLAWFDLSRPSMVEARRLVEQRDQHAAALVAAAAAGEGMWAGLTRGTEASAIRAAIAAHTPGSLQLEREVAELWLRPELPPEGSLGFVDDLRLGRYARVGRHRGYETMILTLLFASTGEQRYADGAVAAILRKVAMFPGDGGLAVNGWHPCSSALLERDAGMCLEYWLPVWPLLDPVLQPEDRLTVLKAILPAARSLLLANREDISFNLTLHPTFAALMVAASFPALRESPAWLDELAARLSTTYVSTPFSTPDGYTREGTAYHSVNTRLLLWSHLVFRNLGRELPALTKAAESALALQVPFTCPDGSGWMLGDGSSFFHHEPWIEGHDVLHLGAVVFNHPEWKALAGSATTTDPNLFTLWMMRADGIARWAALPRVDLGGRTFTDGDAPASSFHVLRAGHGLDAHAGMLWFGSDMNHAHHDKGQVLLYGLGRHLLSDYGQTPYGIGGDMSPCYSARLHGVAAIIRRTPMGPRTDYTDYVRHLARVRNPQASLAMGEHHFYENHIVQRALIMISPWGEADPGRDVFWLIWDRVTWKRGWPGTAPEIQEIIETGFPFHAPGCDAVVCDGGRSIVSRYDGPDGAPYIAGGPTRAELRTAHRYADSDANLQVTRLEIPGSTATWDAVVQKSQTNRCGGPFVDRPMGLFRWRGHLAHHAGYVLVPFRGVRNDVAVAVSGEASADGLSTRVAMPSGTVQVTVRGLSTLAPTVTVTRL